MVSAAVAASAVSIIATASASATAAGAASGTAGGATATAASAATSVIAIAAEPGLVAEPSPVVVVVALAVPEPGQVTAADPSPTSVVPAIADPSDPGGGTVFACFAVWRLLQAPAAGIAAWLFLAGALIFSGSLYLMAFGGPRILGAVTPIGGLLLLAGWVVLAWACFAGTNSAPQP